MVLSVASLMTFGTRVTGEVVLVVSSATTAGVVVDAIGVVLHCSPFQK